MTSDKVIRQADVIKEAEKLLISDETRHLNDLEYGNNQALYHLIDRVEELPSVGEIIYGNEHNCIMTLFGECSYSETGCGSCAVVERVRKALSEERL